MNTTDTFQALKEARQVLINQLTAQGEQEDRTNALYQTTRGLDPYVEDKRFENYYTQLRALRLRAVNTVEALAAYQHNLNLLA